LLTYDQFEQKAQDWGDLVATSITISSIKAAYKAVIRRSGSYFLIEYYEEVWALQPVSYIREGQDLHCLFEEGISRKEILQVFCNRGIKEKDIFFFDD
jgi:hypothetical protein